jgi:hypothetical protein
MIDQSCFGIALYGFHAAVVSSDGEAPVALNGFIVIVG